MPRRIVIVGAGQAGLAAAAKLRQAGFAGSITMLGDEGLMPYQRPPLSKAYLLGKLEADRLSYRNEEFYRHQEIEVARDEAAVEIDRAAREVVTTLRRSPTITLCWQRALVRSNCRHPWRPASPTSSICATGPTRTDCVRA